MSTDIAAVIVAAGRGTRAGADASPKQYARLAGETLLTRATRAFTTHAGISRVVVVITQHDLALYSASMVGLGAKVQKPAVGGATRQASVRAGLEALAQEPPQAVLIHDAARPFVSGEVIGRVIAALEDHDGAIAAVPAADTLKRSTAARTIAETIDRTGLWRAQTPQGFHFGRILDAHRRAAAAGITDLTDDAAVAEWAGLQVALVEGAEVNRKLTTREDIEAAGRSLATPNTEGAAEFRTGVGFDVHRFKAGDHVMLGGVRIPHDHGVEGHSDADVVLHALTDALLGAIADGDIGVHFPPSDAAWKGAASNLFLADAARRVQAVGGQIMHVDITVLCELPRIGPHRDEMRARIGALLGLAPARVSIKATTTEGLGFIGRGEGLVAQAVATVRLPWRAL